MEKNLTLNSADYESNLIYTLNETIFNETTDNDKDTENKLVITSKVPFDTVVGIVDAVYNAMLNIPDNMYFIKRPLLVYHILNEMSNLDVSDILEINENDNKTNDTEQKYKVNLDKAFALSVSDYGKIINTLLSGSNGYNSVYAIGQLLDKKLEILERNILNSSPSDDVLNELWLIFNNINTTLDKIGEKVNVIDIEKLNKKISKITPKSLIEAYTNIKFAKSKEAEILDFKNEEIRDLKQKLNKLTAKNVMADNVVEIPKKNSVK